MAKTNSSDKKADQSLRESEELFRMTFEQAAVGIAHALPDGKFLRINQKFCDIVGYTKEEMQSLTFQEITHPDDLDVDLEHVRKVLVGKIETYSLEKRYLKKDGDFVWINLTVSLLREDNGEPRYFIAVVEDINERKEAEDLLEISQAITHVGNWSIKRGAEIAVCSDEVSRIFGLPVGATCTFEMFNEVIHPDDREYVKKSWMTALNHDQFDITYRLLVDGQIKWVAVKAESMFHKEDETISAIGTVQDITERKQGEEAQKERLRFQKLVSSISARFIGIIEDEFEHAVNESLSQIVGYFDVDSVKLYRLSLKGEVLKLWINWRAEGLAPPNEMPELLKRNYQGFAEHYSQGESIFFDSSRECPPWPGMRETMEFIGVKAGLGVPLETNDLGVDIFAMDKIQADFTWPKDILQSAEIIGRIILGALRRREAEVQVYESYNEIKLLKERLEVENIYLRDQISVQSTHKDIIGKSDAMKYVLYKIKQVATSDATVLILGETGTGKELVAEAIQSESSRRNRPFVKVNCAALPSNLIESELFGREKGAFTGSQARQIGRFELADKGTIFLDEVGELPLELQAKLLRAVQSGEFERLGSPHSIKVDVRIIASTNRDLINEVKKGNFREDLYYRLNVFPVTVPPLRERKEDIPMIVTFFLKKFGKKIGKQIERVPYDVIKTLQDYQWPGNVRELENIIERSMIISPNSTLHLADKLETSKTADNGTSQSKNLSEVERDHILQILDQCRWKIEGKNGAAEILNLHPSTLRTRMRKLGIKRSV